MTIDYFPLLPWLGVIIIGTVIGQNAYHHEHVKTSRRVVSLSNHASSKVTNIGHALAWPGRHALAIYLLHQPLILGVLWFFFDHT